MRKFNPSDMVFPIGPEDSRKEIVKLRTERDRLKVELAEAVAMLDELHGEVIYSQTDHSSKLRKKVKALLAKHRAEPCVDETPLQPQCFNCFYRQYVCSRLPNGTWTEESLCPKHRAEPCGTCGDTEQVEWDQDDSTVEAKLRMKAPCPDCTEGAGS